jgi:drug/metabolite transporter (DMT)-like permease
LACPCDLAHHSCARSC